MKKITLRLPRVKVFVTVRHPSLTPDPSLRTPKSQRVESEVCEISKVGNDGKPK